MCNLFKIGKATWRIEVLNELPLNFATIELAATHLEQVGALDEEIDIALASLYINAHSRAQFNLKDGHFMMSDHATPNEYYRG